MYGINDVDCGACRYGADGGRNTTVCCYYGSEETDPYGKCKVFEPFDDNQSLNLTNAS